MLNYENFNQFKKNIKKGYKLKLIKYYFGQHCHLNETRTVCQKNSNGDICLLSEKGNTSWLSIKFSKFYKPSPNGFIVMDFDGDDSTKQIELLEYEIVK